jgi:hypothetical protein
MLCIALLAVVVRETCDLRHARVQGAPEQGWFTLDPDSLYHMRRVERALDEGLPPAETDPRMNAPVGARIPWPPYYTYVAWAACAPFAPENPDERARHIEERAATLPCVFAALASVLLALTARRLARERTESEQLSAAAIAGGTYALLGASLQYSAIGNGDHHAWVVLLLAAIAFVASKALRGDELDDARLGLRNGVLLGVLCGLLVGSWVGGLVYAVLLEIALGLALFAHSKRARRGLAALGLGMHAAWAITIAPAVLSSPWKDEQPWMLVNASWLHLAHPLLGALVFLPLLWEGSERLRVRWPWFVAAVLVALGSALAFADFALARGVREGFAWASRSNEFMAFITESQPLLWGPIGGFGPLTELLGFGVLLSPIALGWLLLVAWRERRLELAFVAILFAALLAQALTQRRFADAFGVPLALALALFFSRALERVVAPSNGMASALGLLIALAAGFPTLRLAQARAETSWYEIERDPARERRGLYERLRELPGSDEPVLASWDHGHAIEWIARKPSIATNFGSYLGRDSYLDPWRFFLESDPRAAGVAPQPRRALRADAGQLHQGPGSDAAATSTGRATRVPSDPARRFGLHVPAFSRHPRRTPVDGRTRRRSGRARTRRRFARLPAPRPRLAERALRSPADPPHQRPRANRLDLGARRGRPRSPTGSAGSPRANRTRPRVFAE